MLSAGVATTFGALALSGSVTSASAAPCSSPYVKGDVFASVGSGIVDVFTPTGASVCILDDGTGADFTTGSGFDKAGNFYVTDFGGAGVSKFNNSGGLVAGTFMAPGAVATPESFSPVSVGPFTGSSFVGGPDTPAIDQYDTATGALIKSFAVEGGNGTGGTDWVDLRLDGHTILYDGEGTVIRTFDLSTDTQGPDFATAPNASLFALRVIPDGTFEGDVLAADSSDAIMFDSSGALIKTYTLPGNEGEDFSLNLDPNGTDFSTGDSRAGMFGKSTSPPAPSTSSLTLGPLVLSLSSASSAKSPPAAGGGHGSGAFHLGDDASRLYGDGLHRLSEARGEKNSPAA